HARYQGGRALINTQVTDLVETTAARLQAWGLESADEVRGAHGPVAALSEEMAALNSELREFLFEHVYRHFRIQRMGMKARRIVTELFQSLTTEPGQLPRGLLSPASRATETSASADTDCTGRARSEPQGLNQVVCDYIAGLS